MGAVAVAVVATGIITALICWMLKLKKLTALVDRFPGPRYFPIIGNIPYFKKDPTEFFEQTIGTAYAYNNPRIFRIWMFWYPFFVVSGAEEAEVLLSSTKHINKGMEYRMLHPWMGLGLLTRFVLNVMSILNSYQIIIFFHIVHIFSDAFKWRPRRKLLTPSFHYDILKDFIEVFNQQSKIMLKKLSDNLDISNEGFNMYQYITLCALDIICETAMGRHVNAQKNSDSDYVRAIYKLNRIIHERQKKPHLWPNIIFRLFGKGKEQEECLKILHSFTWKVIQERREEVKQLGGWAKVLDRQMTDFEMTSQKRRLAFLDLLLQIAEQGKLTDQDIREEVDTFMFEGHDTTSAGMNWALHLLGCNPAIQAKVHEELDSIFSDDDRDATFEDVKNMTYLECCLKEALRLFPSVPLFARFINEDFDIGGLTIPSGSEVIVSPYGVHRDPRHWPDPEIFDPDRFLPKNANGRHPFAYLPFSAGSRNCIGQRFALMEEKVVVSWILRYFEVTSVQRRDQIFPKAELIIRPTETILIKLKRRQPLSFA
ncbi:Cytochrome P450 4V2 [Trichinella pseudospiralis]|uniref:Cytochrome P450 4V2 n=2 Tax=Trichinella pseudospiralis TaxID=6337 RepID=A0A0V1IYJ7_TRIPS|nr:Cytochrome P450 4V2 [Trichinella pseudospiralis]KRY88536.1 Cytochrome P450 4V2 [Trichinella pseudospiralis]KRZ27724.1 Cytochrome P450 4V2 [Trichinella pseudospiralis]KRZ36682.1 Cytochrome P450 4V2 [Trichinella pseudospiralis]